MPKQIRSIVVLRSNRPDVEIGVSALMNSFDSMSPEKVRVCEIGKISIGATGDLCYEAAFLVSLRDSYSPSGELCNCVFSFLPD